MTTLRGPIALACRALAALLALPAAGLAGAGPATVATHVMVPATMHASNYRFASVFEPQGLVRVPCQVAPQDLSHGPFCYGPDQIRSAYDIQPVLDSGITGAGETIVIIDAFQSPTLIGDLGHFNAAWRLPAAPVNVIAPYGLTPFDPTNKEQVGWSGEISLDVEWAHAIAPGATIDLVLATDSSDASLFRVTRYAVDHDLGDVISQSFGEAEACMDPSLQAAQHRLFRQATRRHISLFAAAGDIGAAQRTCDGKGLLLSASTPASDPNVTAVGGTTLHADGVSGAYQSESVWRDPVGLGAGGGGFSTVYERPDYQDQSRLQSRHRGLPDVAYDGDPTGGFLVAWSLGPFGPGFYIFGGASAGTPQWAGIAALADQGRHHRLGLLNPMLYELAAERHAAPAFHDIVAGDNSFGGVHGYAATRGWDPASGLGTPDVARLLAGFDGRPGEAQD